MLFESQEVIFQKLSEVLSQSSHSTNVGELEDSLLQGLGSMHCISDANSEEADSFPKYDLRTRKVKKLSLRQTSDSNVAKRPKLKIKKKEPEPLCWSPNDAESAEVGGGCSQESVSMLQECYEKTSANEFPELMETCMESELTVINIYSEEEPDSDATRADVPGECMIARVERSTQTDSAGLHIKPGHPRELEMAKHSSFISSVVKLKAILSSRKSVSDRKLRDILTKGAGEDACTSGEGIPSLDWQVSRETIGYLFRSSDAENVFRETVEALLVHLEDALRENLWKMACFWKNSVYETAVEMLNDAFDSETGVRKMIETYLFRFVRSILKNEDKLKNLMLESKTMFVISFCRSAHLSYDAINYIIAKLGIIKTVRLAAEHTSVTEKLLFTHVTKNSYFVLRILESLLESFKAKLAEGKIEDIVNEKPEVKNFNVLEMWKRHWRRNEVLEERKKRHKCETAVSGWCEQLDQISVHCLNHVPILSMVVERCGELSKEIFTMYHPAAIKDGQKITSAAEKSDGDAELGMDL